MLLNRNIGVAVEVGAMAAKLLVERGSFCCAF